MKLKISAIGRMKSGPEKELLDHYVNRCRKAGRVLHLDGPQILEFAESRKESAHQRKLDEEKDLCSTLGVGAKLVVLDPNGQSQTSEALASTVTSYRDNGCPELVFAIGGPDGHGSNILKLADNNLALGKLTWPHQMARIMLSEQLYRVCTIISGHPYHRA